MRQRQPALRLLRISIANRATLPLVQTTRQITYRTRSPNRQTYPKIANTLDGASRVVVAAGARVNRVDSFPGLGWLCPRKIYVDELEPVWPDYVWDVWIRLNDVRKGE